MKKQTKAPAAQPKIPTTRETRESMTGKLHRHDKDRVHDDNNAEQLPDPEQDDSFTILKNDEDIPVKNPG